MTDATTDIAAATRHLVTAQLIFSAIGAAAGLYWHGPWGALSSSYGSLISITTTLLLSWGVKRAEAAAASNPRKSQAVLYLGAAQRFLVVILLFLFGLAVLKLDPLMTVIGFGLAHIGYFLNIRRAAS